MRFILLTTAALLAASLRADACTGITLRVQDKGTVVARTIEWGGSNLNSRYVVVPRGYEQHSMLPDSKLKGAAMPSKYGYVGLSVEMEQFVAEGINEAGLSAGLFYFPDYGRYEDFDPALASTSVADLQLVAWMLGGYATVDEVMRALRGIHVVALDPRASTVHWRITDASGRQVVLEIVDGHMQFHESKLGVLTNSPGYEWQITNLNNYVNLYAGGAADKDFGAIRLAAFGAGSGMLGIPGDVTPPSRFVRAAFYQVTAPPCNTATEAVMQGFQILNNFDIPIGIETAEGETAVEIPSATQWTSATDMSGGKIYYRTMYNSAIRLIDLNTIDFGKTSYKAAPLDTEKEQPFFPVNINRN